MRVRIEFDSRRWRIAFRCALSVIAALGVAVPLYASQVGTLITFSSGQQIRASDFNANFTALKVAIDDTDNKCGDLTTLTTTAKTSLAAAVNEVNGKIPSAPILTSVTTDSSLTGNGTAASPLGVSFASGETTYDGRYLELTGGTISGALDVQGPTTLSPPSGLSGADSILTIGGTATGAGAKGGRALVAYGGDASGTGTGTGGTAIDATGGIGPSGGTPGLAGNFHGPVSMAADLGLTITSSGAALTALGSTPTGAVVAPGGVGITVYGGAAHFTGVGGDGIVASGGAGAGGFLSGNAGTFLGNVLITNTGPLGGGSLFVDGNVSFAASAGVFQFGSFGGTSTTTMNGSATVNGNLTVNGTLSKTAGSFKIDHPLDPENKFLFHSFVESPDMKNVYDGVVALDAKGEATVELPSYFEALNKDFRYQLTCVGGAAVVYVAEKIHENRFKIAGGREGLEVSWQVTGIRHDAYADAHRIQVEVEKSSTEKGKFLCGRPESSRIASTKPDRSEGAHPAPTAGSKRD
jgi:hypothetical protein